MPGLTTIPALFLPAGDHASRPAAGDVAKGSCYPCVDHGVIYQTTDGATWDIWHNPADAGIGSHTHSGADIVGGTIDDAELAASLTRDSELAAAISAHEGDTTAIHGITDTSALDTVTARDAAIAAHTGDATDAHDASAISFAPAGSIAATDVQAAIEEVAAEAGASTDLDAIIAGSSGQDVADALAGAAAPDASNVFATMADVGVGGAQSHAELDAATLINATSAGDAGNRADHFPGTSLDAAWAATGPALTGGPAVRYSSMGALQTSANGSYILRAFTPSGAFRVECRMKVAPYASGFIVRDSGTVTAGGNGMMVYYAGTGEMKVYSLDAGAFTQRGVAAVAGWIGGEAYLAIERNGSNSWSLYCSKDRALWIPVLTGYSKTFTVGKLGFYMDAPSAISTDFVDVVS